MRAQNHRSPGGTSESASSRFQSSLRDFQANPPAINRWAIFSRPYGTVSNDAKLSIIHGMDISEAKGSGHASTAIKREVAGSCHPGRRLFLVSGGGLRA